MFDTQQDATFTRHELGDGHVIHTGSLPEEYVWSEDMFEEFWDLHPEDYHEITIHGRLVKTPRWQQAYGANYHYTGQINKALPVPLTLQPLLHWAHEQVDERLNGLLLNWYDAQLSHYIGPHHDSTKAMIPGAPIGTISFGEERIFRLTQGKGTTKRSRDFPVSHGCVIVMPFVTNRAWKHSVPHFARYRGRRISVTLRAFSAGVLPPENYFDRTLERKCS